MARFGCGLARFVRFGFVLGCVWPLDFLDTAAIRHLPVAWRCGVGCWGVAWCGVVWCVCVATRFSRHRALRPIRHLLVALRGVGWWGCGVVWCGVCVATRFSRHRSLRPIRHLPVAWWCRVGCWGCGVVWCGVVCVWPFDFLDTVPSARSAIFPWRCVVLVAPQPSAIFLYWLGCCCWWRWWWLWW